MTRKLKTESPGFGHSSWDYSIFTLNGYFSTTYNDGSDQARRTRVTNAHKNAVAAYRKLGSHNVDPMKTTVEGWADTIEGYGRVIHYSEAEAVAEHLETLTGEIAAQVARDQLRAKQGRDAETAARAAKAAQAAARNAREEAESQALLVAAYGHTVSTAKTRPQPAAARKEPKRTPEEERAENWRWKQRNMGTQCDNTISFGAHPVNQDSVLGRLDLPGGQQVFQARDTPENTHRRVMRSNGVPPIYYWTDGLTHQERRDAGRFSVYRRTGANTFTHVSGERVKEDPG